MRTTRYAALVAALVCVASPALARRRPAAAPSPSPTPIPTPAATPLSAAAKVRRLRERIETLARSTPGRLGVCAYDIFSDERVALRGDEGFALGGTVAFPLALAVYRRADQHVVDLDARTLVTAADLRHGTSPIASRHPRGNAYYTYDELVRALVIDGDTTASDLLLATVGGPAALERFLRNLGATGFAIRKTQADVAADLRARRTFAQGADNAGTPNGFADLLNAFEQQHFTLLDTTNALVTLLSHANAAPARLRAGLPTTASLAHVAGSSESAPGVVETASEAGIVTFADGRRVVVVAMLEGSYVNETERDAVFAEIARAVSAAFAP